MILTSAFVPVIIDADALNAIAAHPYLTSYYTENIIITPHLGEMSRLTGKSSKRYRRIFPRRHRSTRPDTELPACSRTRPLWRQDGTEICTLIPADAAPWPRRDPGMCLPGLSRLIAIGTEEEQAAFLGVYIPWTGRRKSRTGQHSMLASELRDAPAGCSAGWEERAMRPYSRVYSVRQSGRGSGKYAGYAGKPAARDGHDGGGEGRWIRPWSRAHCKGHRQVCGGIWDGYGR